MPVTFTANGWLLDELKQPPSWTSTMPAMPPVVEIAGVLETAADYLDRYGWCQGTMREGLKACAVGAIAAVTPGSHTRWAWARVVVTRYFNRARGEVLLSRVYDDTYNWNSLPAWNDQPERVASDVTDLFLQCANELRCIAETLYTATVPRELVSA